jgi:uncharacterized protein YbjT (DUF2867 family)
MTTETHIVTGAFEYSGGFIARRLLAAGHAVRTLTSVAPRGELADRVQAFPMAFDDPARLIEAMRGAKVLYNTFWVRFNKPGLMTQEQAVANTLRLFDCARQAGVERVVHVSISNPSDDSPYDYFRHKARMEKALVESGLSHAILRPAVLFGGRDILVNNIAWVVRHMPFVGLFGRGAYRLQPIYVDDLAKLACEQGASRDNRVIDAVGPETFTYRGLFEKLGEILGVRRPIVPLPKAIAYATVWAFGKRMHDVILTWQEVGALMDGLLCTDSPPAGTTKLTDWARERASTLGQAYASELARRSPASWLPPRT